MPAKTSLEAIFGATAVFHLEELCRAEALMVILQDIFDFNFNLCNWFFSLSSRLKITDLLLFVLNIRYKYNPWWIHAFILQKRPWFCWSQRASGSFTGINSIKWGWTSELRAYCNIQPYIFELAWTFKVPSHLTMLLLTVHLLLFWCYFRLCNMAVWPESDEHIYQHAVGQQEHPWSAASPTGTDHPRANRLVCQIWTPLVPSLEPWSALLRTLSPPKSRPSCFITQICTYILHSNNFVCQYVYYGCCEL